MKTLLAAATLSLITPAVRAQDVCSLLAGASVVADDGQFLGKISSEFDGQSIFNEFGTYGSEFSAKSIWNQFGKYGGEFSPLSPFNKSSTKPPAIVKGGQIVAFLTVNKSIEGGVNPYYLKTCEF